MSCYGFAILRNGVKYDYPFEASLNSLSSLCDDVVLALGDSEDETNQRARCISKIQTFDTVWGKPKPDGGHVLSEQTNLALNELRKKHSHGWGFYLQADEVLSEKDFELIREDLKKAQAQGCDAIRFRYYHFWKRYDQIAVTKRWYPQEIRAIRLDSDIDSFGDAQSFKNHQKVYESDARIFHYGHVKTQEKLDEKNHDFGLWWHTEKELKQVLEKGKKKEKSEYLLPYLGHHPKFMQKRITEWNERNDIETVSNSREIYIYAKNQSLTSEILDAIHAKVHLVQKMSDLKNKSSKDCFIFESPSFIQKLLLKNYFKTRVPNQMLSPQARPFTLEQYASLRLSEKKIGSDL